MSNFSFYGEGMEVNEVDNIKAAIDGDFIELHDDDGCIYARIPINKWQELKDAIDAKLHGKYHHLRELIKRTNPIKLD